MESGDRSNICVHPQCSNRRSASHLSFHRFPRDQQLREMWLEIIGLKEFQPTSSSCLCSDHFSLDTFSSGKKPSTRRVLKYGSLPIAVSSSCTNQAVESILTSSYVGPSTSTFQIDSPPRKKRILERPIIEELVDSPTVEIVLSPSSASLLAEGGSLSSSGDDDPLAPPQLPQKEPISQLIDESEGPTQVCSHCGHNKTSKLEETPTKLNLRRQVKILKQRLARRERRIHTLKHLVHDLRQKLGCPSLAEVVENNFSGFPLEMLLSSISNKKIPPAQQRYTESTRQFAITLNSTPEGLQIRGQ